jgi:hypothetical protein
MVPVVVGDENRHAPGVAGGERPLDGGQVGGVVRAGVDQDGLPAAGRADDVGVRAVQGHTGGVGGEHAGDQRLELGDRRHGPQAWQVPCCARVGRDVHARHGSRAAPGPCRRQLACLPMGRTLSFCRSGLAAAAAVVLLTACGGSDDDTTAAETTTSSSSSSASETTENSAPQADSEFCTQAAAIQERIAASFTGQTDQGSLGELFTQISQEVQAIEPPAELAADWTAFAEGVNEIAAISQVDFTDQAAVAEWQQQVLQIQSQYGSAFTNVESYLSTQCGITDGESTETASPTS